jgi:ATP-binding cassette subfamily B protein
MKKIIKLLSPFAWAVKISWQTNRLLFIFTSLSSFITSSVSGIINTYIAAQTTASVALLATKQVSIRTPITWAIIFGLFNLLLDIIRRITSYYDFKFMEQLNITISTDFVSKVSSFTQEQLDDSELQKGLNMAGRELYTVRSASNTIQNIFTSFSAYLLSVIVVWRFAWGIGLLLLFLIPILAVSNYYQTKRKRKSWEDSTMHYRIASGLFSYLTNPLRLFEIKIMGAREKIIKLRLLHLKKENKMLFDAERKNILYGLFEDLASPLIEMGTRIWAIILVAGGRLAFDQFLFVIGLIQQASSQTFNLGYSISNAQETYLATTSLRDIMDIPDAPDGNQKIHSNTQGLAIELENVSLMYKDGTVALEDINMHIKAGQKIAIVGENGAGKTSLLRLITRQYNPSKGKITIDGIPYRRIKRDSLYENTSVLSQDFYLFEDLTIKQNLEIATQGRIDQNRIDEALRSVHMTDKINSLAKKLNTRLDKSYEDGADLSGGQRQRLAIARALLKPFTLLILDEPTSAIDAKAERSIFNSIFEKSSEATVLIVSHRFATVRKADYIYVLDRGRIIEQGSHQDLISQNGHYAELYNIQAQDFA